LLNKVKRSKINSFFFMLVVLKVNMIKVDNCL
jgi:hypothetical protein